MIGLPYWIQHADFASDEFDQISAQSISEVFLGYDWRDEFEKMQALKVAEKDSCPPGLGINAHDGRILHICPDGNNRCEVNYSFYQMEKLFGIFPRRKYQAGVIDNVPLDVAAQFIDAFFNNNYAAVQREVEMRQ